MEGVCSGNEVKGRCGDFRSKAEKILPDLDGMERSHFTAELICCFYKSAPATRRVGEIFKRGTPLKGLSFLQFFGVGERGVLRHPPMGALCFVPKNHVFNLFA